MKLQAQLKFSILSCIFCIVFLFNLKWMFNVVVTRSILNRNKAIYSMTPYNRPQIIWSPLYLVASWKLNTTCFPWLADVKALLADDKSPVAHLCWRPTVPRTSQQHSLDQLSQQPHGRCFKLLFWQNSVFLVNRFLAQVLTGPSVYYVDMTCEALIIHPQEP